MPGSAPRSMRRGVWVLVLALALMLTPVLTIAIGAAAVPPDQVVGVVLSYIPGLDVEITWERNVDAIVWATRVPRILAGVAIVVILGVFQHQTTQGK